MKKITVILLTAVVVLSVASLAYAQEERWNELNEKLDKLWTERNYQEAIKVAEEMLKVAEKTFGSKNPKVVQSISNLGRLYEIQDKYGEAEALYKRALAIKEETFGVESPELASAIYTLATFYQEHGKFNEAEELYKRRLAIQEKADPESPDTPIELGNLARFYVSQQRYTEAEPLYLRALAIREKVYGKDHPYITNDLQNLAELYRDEGKYARAEPFYKRWIAMEEKFCAENKTDFTIYISILGQFYRDYGKYAEAEELYKKVLVIKEKEYNEMVAITKGAYDIIDSRVSTALMDLAVLYEIQNRGKEAEEIYKRIALSCKPRPDIPSESIVALLINFSAESSASRRRYKEAELLYKRALAMAEAVAPNHYSTAIILENMAGLYEKTGKKAEAQKLKERTAAITPAKKEEGNYE